MSKQKKLLLAWLLLVQSITFAQYSLITLSGLVRDKSSKTNLPYVNVLLKTSKDSIFITGTITNDKGRFSFPNIQPGKYLLEFSYSGYSTILQPVFIGNLSPYLDLAAIELEPVRLLLGEVVVTGKQEGVAARMDKKTFTLDNNITQGGGSVLQAMQNLPGVTVQEGKVQLRGSDKVAVLVDGKQTALTGFDNQASLDNIPASAIERIEIINNPSAKYDANGNAGIINIIFRKNKKEGFNGRAGIALGLGALWEKQENLPGIRPQFQGTPKVNPSLALNNRKKNINTFFQGDLFYNPTLNKNEFVTRTYENGDTILQQTKRNRETTISTVKAGMDWTINNNNQLSFSGLFSSEKIIDNGDEPFYNKDLTELKRLWQFLEDEVKTTVTAATAYQHKFSQPGHLLNIGLNYTFHREDEKYFFTNQMPDYTGYDAFKLLSDEHVTDFSLDYTRPLKHGRLETGIKYRWRNIPTEMIFYPGLNSPIDSTAGGWAVYKEHIPALYGNYVFENDRYELEAGLRMEYVSVNYDVDPNHNTYKSDGYSYTKPFPNLRLAYKFNERNKLSFFFNRRVDRPAELDIRVFPKYDDAEIIKVGNPALQPQYTNTYELGYKTGWSGGSLYSALYHKASEGTITRIGSIQPGSTIIYNIMQNAGKSRATGVEMLLSGDVSKSFSFNLNLNLYRNQIDSFTVENLYPSPNTFSAPTSRINSGNIKLNAFIHLPKQLDLQLTAIYLAPDIIPQGRIDGRFTLDAGIKKQIQKGKGELYLNATDLFNTMVIRKEIKGDGFSYTSSDYYETQVIRLGYHFKF
ncbi:TonB-dependent receptor [Flavihumibacter rivuli]|uniref:TonB-dependent receptor domain-containing protein n=1 Tax=Flavihumibacter rivuli TaxID=2838156 RepID=UPI001BDE59CA|nr:TonB-dependent receptor [Flavihumibacter rivuli]ULQ55947.1 TonB-dependent receptor [Flavihumibacter rivuli]